MIFVIILCVLAVMIGFITAAVVFGPKLSVWMLKRQTKAMGGFFDDVVDGGGSKDHL